MSLNFFNEECQYPIISLPIFGLCDDQNGTKAYPNFNNPNIWIAEVKNEKQYDIVVTAIDKCILNDNDLEGRSRCDCMLTTCVHLYLVELKDKQKQWREEGIEQLESTIQIIKENHNISNYSKRKVFVCNKKYGRFATIDNERNKAFLNKTGFRIDIQGKIVVI